MGYIKCAGGRSGLHGWPAWQLDIGEC